MAGKKRGFRSGKTKNATTAENGVVPVDDRDVKGHVFVTADDMKNVKFERYYKLQNIIPEEEWDQFMESLRTPLPTVFRLTSNRPIAKSLNEHIIHSYLPSLQDVVFEDKPVPPPKQIAWYPEGFAWQIDVPKQVLRRNEQFKNFHRFLVSETDTGNITRQELVSMIPPLFLDVEPHHHVLDTCASPGSKSSQILEFLQQQASATTTTDNNNNNNNNTTNRPTPIPSGVLISNDQSLPRCHMLIHQSLLRVPSPLMMVTNQDASSFLKLRIVADSTTTESEGGSLTLGSRASGGIGTETGGDGGDGLEMMKVLDKDKSEKFKFDRILCDVPCSGDGTMRKNLQIWSKWSNAEGIGLHALQLRILQRSIEMLRPGGKLVYSTCSLNPLENEAVVSAALDLFPATIHLLSTTPHLPDLLRRPGLTTWKVCNVEGQEIPKLEGTPRVQKGKGRTKVRASMFPNGMEKERGLERCLRIYPHLQNTGGFFVAVLQKRETPLPLPPKNNLTTTTTTMTTGKGSSSTTTQSNTNKNEAGGGVASDLKQAEKRTATDRETPPPTSASPTAEGSSGGPREKKRARIDDDDSMIENDENKNKDEKDEEDDPEVEVEAEVEEVEDFVEPQEDSKASAYKEEPFTYLAKDQADVQEMIKFFEMSEDFPAESLLVRNPNGQPSRAIYLTSPAVRRLVLANDYRKIRLVSCGVKVFQRQDASKDGTYPCRWRVVSEGMPTVRPYLGQKRIIKPTSEQFRSFMEKLNVPLNELEDGLLKERIDGMELGSLIIDMPSESLTSFPSLSNVSVGGWKSRNSISLMVDKKEKSALSVRLYGEDVTPHAPGRAKVKQNQTDSEPTPAPMDGC